jgi:hypothetical protein
MTEKKEALLRLFRSWDGVHETEDFAQNLVVGAADELEMIGDALDQESPLVDVAVRCIRRAVDRLRLAVELLDEDAVIPEPAATEAENTFGGLRVVTLDEQEGGAA